MTAAASAAPSLAARSAATFTAGTTPTTLFTARPAATAATRTVFTCLVGAHPASVRVSTELVAATEAAASPRSDLGLI